MPVIQAGQRTESGVGHFDGLLCINGNNGKGTQVDNVVTEKLFGHFSLTQLFNDGFQYERQKGKFLERYLQWSLVIFLSTAEIAFDLICRVALFVDRHFFICRRDKVNVQSLGQA